MAFNKILIANRGEIACRIMRTAGALAYRTVAVYSDADADALHVRMADEAVRIGPPSAADSYLNIPAILEAAQLTGADAIHPGYGFLSENDAFARAVEAAGLLFIGPTSEAIRAMGNKAAAKRAMLAAGVPCVPGYQGSDQSDATLLAEARRIGFPVMIKAAAGGGGRGMRLVAGSQDFAAAVSAARAEARSAFGSDELILEKAVQDARHIEVQIIGDAHGNIIHLGERDCSIQRRHQKVIEEAPSPAISPELRARLGAAAIKAARAIDYRSAGTVEFLLDGAGAFYFLEMNTRIQVEHPVTEAITGLDIVALQLEIAAGARLGLTQEQVRFGGHAIEARLYAEDPAAGFLPQSGRLLDWSPAAVPGVRTDHGLTAGQQISPDYDPMLAKIIAHGATREEARRRLMRAIEETYAPGLVTNRAFLAAALAHPVFAAGEATTAFIDKHFAAGSAGLQPPSPDAALAALAAALLFEAGGSHDGWRSTGPAPAPMRVSFGGAAETIAATGLGAGGYRIARDGGVTEIVIIARDRDAVRYASGGVQRTARFARDGSVVHLERGLTTVRAEDVGFATRSQSERGGSADLHAPMHGRVVAVLTETGAHVAKGQRLIVLEAMKMQHEIVAERDGVVREIAVRAGDQVATRQRLVSLEADQPRR